jgi:hypothetical protein
MLYTTNVVDKMTQTGDFLVFKITVPLHCQKQNMDDVLAEHLKWLCQGQKDGMTYKLM